VIAYQFGNQHFESASMEASKT